MNEIRYKIKFHKLRQEEDMCIVSNDNLEMFFLDNISSDIFLVFKVERSINQAVKILLEDFFYDVEECNLIQDVENLVDEFLRQDLMEVIYV